MQKVKDRKAKIEQRASEKKDELQRVEEAEHQKEQWMEEASRTNSSILDSFGIGENDESNEDRNSESDNDSNTMYSHHATKVYDDPNTETTWGGQVTVTTSVVELDDCDDDDFSVQHSRHAKSVDVAQKYAGNVQRYMDELKGNMPGKKNRDNGHRVKRKGKNGAAEMRGVGGSGNLKIASKLLHKSRDRGSTGGTMNSRKGKRRKR